MSFQTTLASSSKGKFVRAAPFPPVDASPSWHKHSMDVRFEHSLEIVYCVRRRREW